jgi:NADH-quinone oxidoreductase subunit J
MQDTIFYILGAVMIITAFIVVTAKNLLHAALALVSTLFLSAVLFIMLHAEFVAIAQVMVYVGGVVIFMIFSILLTTRLGEKIEKPKLIASLFALISSLLFYFILSKGFSAEVIVKEKLPNEIANIHDFGLRLMNTGKGGFIVPFEIVSILLLAALVGAIVIAKKDKEEEA